MARDRKPEVDFDFGHRLTFRVPVPSPSGPETKARAATEVDVYPFHPPIQATDPDRLTRLPWVLFLAGRSRLQTKRSVPAWTHDLCRMAGWPLVCLDASDDVAGALVGLLAEADAEAGSESYLNWCLQATGPGAEADTGRDALDDRYYFDFVPHGGLDPQRMVLLASQDDVPALLSLWTHRHSAEPRFATPPCTPPRLAIFFAPASSTAVKDPKQAHAAWVRVVPDPARASESDHAAQVSALARELRAALLPKFPEAKF